MAKQNLKNAKTITVLDEMKAYELKWECDKGHTNYVIALEKPKTTDCCLKCGQIYNVNFL